MYLQRKHKKRKRKGEEGVKDKGSML